MDENGQPAPNWQLELAFSIANFKLAPDFDFEFSILKKNQPGPITEVICTSAEHNIAVPKSWWSGNKIQELTES